MHTVDYLKHWSLKEDSDTALNMLHEQYSIKIGMYGDRVMLNYDQINSPKLHNITKECRSLILSYPEFNVISRSFDRFFNYGETFESKEFDFSKSMVIEKCDGSLMKLYHYNNEWHISTRGMAFAEGETETGRTFKTLFLEGVGLTEDNYRKVFKKTLQGYENYTFIFELCSPENRVVKNYGRGIHIYFTGMRDNKTGNEQVTYNYISLFKDFNVKLPKLYSLYNVNEIIKAVNELENLDEGFVCYNTYTGERVKIKSEIYVAVHHLKNNGALTPKKIASLVFENEYDEFLSYFPEYDYLFEPYINAYKMLVNDIKKSYEENKNIENQKDFALKIMNCHYKGILFSMRNIENDGDIPDIFEIFENINDNGQLNLLKHYIKEE